LGCGLDSRIYGKTQINDQIHKYFIFKIVDIIKFAVDVQDCLILCGYHSFIE